MHFEVLDSRLLKDPGMALAKEDEHERDAKKQISAAA